MILGETEIFNFRKPTIDDRINYDQQAHIKSANYLRKMLGYIEPDDKYAYHK